MTPQDFLTQLSTWRQAHAWANPPVCRMHPDDVPRLLTWEPDLFTPKRPSCGVGEFVSDATVPRGTCEFSYGR